MPYMFQLRVQSEVNLHKLRNKIVYASWSQKGAHMSHMQQSLITFITIWTWRSATTYFPMLYYVNCHEDYIVVAKFFRTFKSF
jgi:hypothetical protein